MFNRFFLSIQKICKNFTQLMKRICMQNKKKTPRRVSFKHVDYTSDAWYFFRLIT